MTNRFEAISYGDLVGTWEAAFDEQIPLMLVEKVTPKYIHAGGERWHRGNGYLVGPKRNFTYQHPRIDTEEAVLEQRRHNLAKELSRRLVDYEVPYKRLKELEGVLDGALGTVML